MLAISIHAPPRGATVAAVVDALSVLFQFTPLREGRPFADLLGSARRLFQFTPLREGRRAFSSILHPDGRNISIHAPPRGATKIMAEYTAAAAQFQFTPLREGRPIGKVIEQPGSLFQFTPLREGRPSPSANGRKRKYFNSRPSARGDQKLRKGMCWHTKFQFTPLREGRRCFFPLQPFCHLISIHAPPRGATETKFSQLIGMYFNSRPSARGDFETKFSQLIGMYFNSRPSARGDERHLLAL